LAFRLTAPSSFLPPVSLPTCSETVGHMDGQGEGVSGTWVYGEGVVPPAVNRITSQGRAGSCTHGVRQSTMQATEEYPHTFQLMFFMRQAARPQRTKPMGE
jgi:hypothetical protein